MRASIAATVVLAVSSCKRILIVAAIDAASEGGMGAVIAACSDGGTGPDLSAAAAATVDPGVNGDEVMAAAVGATAVTTADASPNEEDDSSTRS